MQLSTDSASIQEYYRDGHSDLRAEVLMAVLLVVSLGVLPVLLGFNRYQEKQHFLYFFPLPQGQGSLRPHFLGRIFLSNVLSAAFTDVGAFISFVS